MQINLKDENKGKMIANKIEDFDSAVMFMIMIVLQHVAFENFHQTSLFLRE